MMDKSVYSQNDPLYHVSTVHRMMIDVVEHIKEDENRVEDPQALALLETTREVIQGLITAYKHYGERTEKAWNQEQNPE